jgi:hypothetical protein
LAVKGLLDAALDSAASQSKRLARAKEQGFNTDTVYYHSTDKLEGDDLNLEGKEFTILNPSTSGKLGPGVYASPTPAYTERYIRSASQAGDKQLGFGDNSRTLPIFVRGKIGDIKNYNSASDKAKGLLTKEFEEIDAASKNNEFDEIMAFRQKLALQKRKAQEVMADDGFSGFQVSDEIVVFDPKNIRSVNAQFDPKNKDSSKILASPAPVTIGAGLLGNAAVQRFNEGVLGGADFLANAGSAVAEPFITAAQTLRALPTNTPTSEIEAQRAAYQNSLDYQPRTEIGRNATESALGLLGGALQGPMAAGKAIAEPLIPIYDAAAEQYKRLPRRVQLGAESLLDLF